MDSRLRKIESKLSMLQQNTNFFIEMLHNQKRSARLFLTAAVSTIVHGNLDGGVSPPYPHPPISPLKLHARFVGFAFRADLLIPPMRFVLSHVPFAPSRYAERATR